MLHKGKMDRYPRHVYVQAYMKCTLGSMLDRSVPLMQQSPSSTKRFTTLDSTLGTFSMKRSIKTRWDAVSQNKLKYVIFTYK